MSTPDKLNSLSARTNDFQEMVASCDVELVYGGPVGPDLTFCPSDGVWSRTWHDCPTS